MAYTTVFLNYLQTTASMLYFSVAKNLIRRLYKDYRVKVGCYTSQLCYLRDYVNEKVKLPLLY